MARCGTVTTKPAKRQGSRSICRGVNRSDNYMKFDFEPVKDYAKAVGITCRHVADYNPRGNTKVERMMGA